ncbi:uroporphyrinogen-III C-methyltransferase [Bacillus tuaregi]|uniref:uroporphyrinogen-III C-methyltransferase n=1 Tax=Bacillus tuaregi TaxID=1816695 RepID=UPI0008F87C73|nr:uroporphyrinogen-III C-methyltransferase [Bacillus tuaregi]
MNKGKVFLVGAGPGDIGLITVKGLEAIKQAEVILYDRLANPKLLDFAPFGCELIYCGKLPDRHTLRQDGINSLLVDKALEGKRVVRLKGGDPGVFGRVGEEAEALAAAGIQYEMIPGISSGIAAPLYAGIPVTHRQFGETFAVVTAHDQSKEGKPVLDWKALASGIDTIAFYMGVKNLPYICQSLMENGKSPDTPVILIQWGTFSRQKTLEGTLSTIAERASAVQFSNPAITLVGDIVSLREKISWFEKKPLVGRQILLARTGIHSSGLSQSLTEQGADVIEFPKWKNAEVPVNYDVLHHLSFYEEILFTSVESVEEFFQLLMKEQIDIRSLSAELYGLSKKTVNALKERGLLADVTDHLFQNETLLVVGDSRIAHKYRNCNLLITSEKVVDETYLPILKRILTDAKPDSIIFPSAQSVKMFFEEELVVDLFPEEFLQGVKVICMGERSTMAAQFYGVDPAATAEAPTREALIEAIKKIEQHG